MKLNVSEFMILERNPDVGGYKRVKEGQTIMVLNYYASKTILFIDKEIKLPVVEMMYDDQGLYEKSEYYNVMVNPSYQPLDFSKKIPTTISKYGAGCNITQAIIIRSDKVQRWKVKM